MVQYLQAWIAFGMGLGFLLAAIHLVKHKDYHPTYNVATAFLIGLFLMRLYNYLNREQPFGAVLLVTSMVVTGPVILMQLLVITDYSISERARSAWHFLPALFALPIDGYLQWQHWVGDGGYLARALRNPSWDILNASLFFALLHLAGYTAYVIWLNLRLGHTLGVAYRRFLRMLVYIPLPSVACVAFGFLVKNDLLVAIGGSGVTLTLVLMYLISARFPDFFTELTDEIQAKKYARTVLTGIDVEGARAQLTRLMDEEHLYRDETLRLPSLAERMSLSPNQLSRIINESFGQSYNDFLHRYRIEEAQARLAHEPEKAITTIAYEVGYASKATFNKQFARIVGTTPQRYRSRPEQ